MLMQKHRLHHWRTRWELGSRLTHPITVLKNIQKDPKRERDMSKATQSINSKGMPRNPGLQTPSQWSSCSTADLDESDFVFNQQINVSVQMRAKILQRGRLHRIVESC